MAAAGAVELFRLLGVIAVNRGEAIGDIKAVEAQAEKAAQGIARSLDKASRSMQRIGRAMSLAITAPVVAAVGASVREYAAFEAKMRDVNTIAKLNEEQFKAISRQVVELSREVPQSAETLAAGLYDITSASFVGKDGLEVLRASAVAASAGISDTATAAKAITAVLNAYGMTAQSAGHVADVMFKGVEKGVFTFGDLAGSVGNVVASAAAAKVPFEELTAAFATMTRGGIDAATASTSLNRIILSFLQPGKEFAAALKAIGIESAATHLQEKGLAGAVEALNKVAGDNPVMLAQMGLEMRALKAALSLTRNEGRDFAGDIQAMTDASGAAAAAFAEQGKSFRHEWQLVKNQFAAIGMDIAQDVMPMLRGLAGRLKAVADAFGQLTPKQRQHRVELVLFLAAAGPVLNLLGKLITVAKVAVLWFGTHLPAAIVATRTGLATLGSIGAGPLGIFIAAFTAATAGVYELIKALNELSDVKAMPGVQLTERSQIWAAMQQAQKQVNELAAKERAAREKGDTASASFIAMEKSRAVETLQYLCRTYERLTAAARAAQNVVEKSTSKGDADGGGGGGGLTGSGTSAKKGPTRAELSQQCAESLRAEIALTDQGTTARITAETKYWDWRDAAVLKYRDSSVLAEKSLAAQLKEERDRDLADRKADLDQRQQDLDEWQAENLKAVQAQDEADRESADGLWQHRREAAEKALADRIQLEQDWFQYRLDAGQVDLDAYLARLQEELRFTEDGTRAQLDLLKQIDDAKARIARRDAARAEEAERAVRAQMQAMQDSGEWQLMSLEQQAWWLQQQISYYEQQGIAVDNVRGELERVNAEIALGAVTLQNVWLGALRDMGSAFSDFFEGLMEGTRGFGDLMQGVLSAIRRSLADLLAQSVMQPLQGAMARWLGLNVPGAVGGQQGVVLQASPELSKGFGAFAGAAAMLPGPLGAMVGVAAQWVVSATVGKANASVALLAASVQKASASVNLGAAMQSMAAGGLMATAGGVMAAAAAAMVTAAATMAAAAASIGLFGFLGFQEGGVATHPTLAMVAEKEPEVIIPFSKLLAGRAGFSPSPAALPAGKLPAGLAMAGATVNVMPGAMPMSLNADSLDSLQLDRLAARLTPRIATALWNAWRLVPVGRG